MSLTTRLALLAALSLGGAALVQPLQAMQSPWWENYEQKDRFLCRNRSMVVLERNDSQASLITGGRPLLLFREDSDQAGQRYRGGDLLVILKGDELTLERLPTRLVCVRTEQV